MEEKFNNTNNNSNDSNNIELISQNNNSTNINTESQSLEGIDSKFSWLQVFIGFMVHFALFGTAGSFGVYLSEYLNTDFETESSTLLAFIGSLGSGVYAISCIPAGILISKFGHRIIMLTGAFIFGFGLIISSFGNHIWLFFVGQGILFGIGISFCFIPTISIVPQWFHKHLGLAIGICASGSGIGGLIMSPIIQAINDRIGWRWTLRINGIFSILVLSTSAIILKSKVPFKSPKVFDVKIILNTKFIAFWFQGAISSLAFWVPFFLMPLYCQYYGISATYASLMVGLMNGSAAIGRILAGLAAQKIGNINTLLFNNLFCSLSFVLIWYFSTTTWSLILFSLIFGFLAAAFFTNSALLAPELFGLEKLAQVNGLFYTCCAPGYLAGTVIATSIIDASTVGSYTNYLPCMFYLFACYLASCLFLLWLRVQVTSSLIVKV